MKARTRTARWLLIGLLFGFLAVAGLTLTLHRHAATLAKASDVASPKNAVPQHSHAVLAGKRPLATPAGAGPDRQLADNQYPNTASSNTPDWQAAGPPNASTGNDSSSSPPAVDPPHSNRPAASGTGNAPQNGAGDYAFGYGSSGGGGGGGGSYVGGVSAMTGSAADPQARHGSGTQTRSGSGSQSGGGSGSQSGGGSGSQSGGGSGSQSGGGSVPPPPGNGHGSVPAPEFDAATLGTAVTLLIGLLAVLCSRRVRVTR